MSELDSDSTRVLTLARAARTPTEIDRARVAKRLGLGTGVAAAVAAQAAAASSAQAAGLPVQVAAKGAAGLNLFGAGVAWSPVKLGLAGALLVSAATATYLASSRTASESASAEPSRVQQAPGAAPAPIPEPASLQPPAAATPTDSALEAQSIQRGSLRTAQRRTGPNTLATELDLLHRAQSAWRNNEPRRALELLSSHRRSYPSSTLRAEREALQILVLCETGEVRQASRLAKALLQREPNSPARVAIEESCATGSVPARIR